MSPVIGFILHYLRASSLSTTCRHAFCIGLLVLNPRLSQLKLIIFQFVATKTLGVSPLEFVEPHFHLILDTDIMFDVPSFCNKPFFGFSSFCSRLSVKLSVPSGMFHRSSRASARVSYSLRNFPLRGPETKNRDGKQTGFFFSFVLIHR